MSKENPGVGFLGIIKVGVERGRVNQPQHKTAKAPRHRLSHNTIRRWWRLFLILVLRPGQRGHSARRIRLRYGAAAESGAEFGAELGPYLASCRATYGATCGVAEFYTSGGYLWVTAITEQLRDVN